jgi:CubicO group peptidase (beta-lactamase class C family)
MIADEQGADQALLQLLQEGVATGVFPGAVAAVGRLKDGGSVRAQACAGLLEPGGAAVEIDTFYDLASLTKPVIATVALRLSQAGRIDLHAPAARWVHEIAGLPGGEASLAQLLSHRAGLVAWEAFFEQIPDLPGSERARGYVLRAAASRRDPNAPLDPTRTTSVYSDLGYLIVGEALSRAAGVGLETLVQREIADPLGIADRLFYAAALAGDARTALRLRVAPTEHCALRGRLPRGEVHDENCAAFGGICGHAGLFGTAQAVLEFGLAMLNALGGRSGWLDQALVRWALRPLPGGGHVVGWDTRSGEGSSAGLWCDPVRGLCAVLLSNRVHPTRENLAIRAFRPRFHDLVAGLALA